MFIVCKTLAENSLPVNVYIVPQLLETPNIPNTHQ